MGFFALLLACVAFVSNSRSSIMVSVDKAALACVTLFN